MISEFSVYLALGSVAGVLAGLLGVGGGLIIVPVLAWTLARQEVAPHVLMHLAIGTSLATIVCTSLASAYAHQRRGAVDWWATARLTPGILVGAGSGALLADILSTAFLRTFFGMFALGVAIQLALQIQAAPHRELPSLGGMLLAGTVIGSISALAGIGGGSLTVPFLAWCNVPVRRAVATSSACGLPIAAAGATGFLVVGWRTGGLPHASTGYVYWPAFVGIASASVLFAPMGARLAHRLPASVLRRVFAVFLAVVGVRMLLPG